MGFQVHQHNSRSGLDLEVGKQIAALLRLALLSGDTPSMIIEGSHEFPGILSILAQVDGLNWNKILIFSSGEYIGISKTIKGSLQFDLENKFFKYKPECPRAGLINGEAIPSTELNRLNQLFEKYRPDVFLTTVGNFGEIGLIESGTTETEEVTGYRIVEPSEVFRKNQVNQRHFKSTNEIPRKGIALSLNSAFKAKHVVCCLSGKSKTDLVSKFIYQKDLPSTCEKFLKHQNVHLHLDSDSGSELPPPSVA